MNTIPENNADTKQKMILIDTHKKNFILLSSVIDNNSKVTTFLSIVGLILSFCILTIGYIELIIKLFELEIIKNIIYFIFFGTIIGLFIFILIYIFIKINIKKHEEKTIQKLIDEMKNIELYE